MTNEATPVAIRYREFGPARSGQYAVLAGQEEIGRVRRFSMGAGQFGSTWLATTPRGESSTRFRTRQAAAAWLLERTSA